MNAMRIGTRRVGGGAPCYIIAEAGSNHNGSLALARRLIDAAVRAGADAVKFQTFRAEKLYTRRAGRSGYLKLRTSIFDIIRRMEMPYEWIPLLAAHCRRRHVAFISTPFDEESADRLAPFVDVFKIASYELTHHPLLRHVASFRKPILMSTGASKESEVAESVRVLRKAGVRDLCLLQCTAAYPAPLESVNVRVIETLRRRFDCPAGLSDHSRDPIVAPMTAAALGADVLEKHYTLDNKLPGPDHKFSVTPEELADLVTKVRQVEQARGVGVKDVHPVERELRHFARRSLFAIRDIDRGALLSAENVAVLRNGTVREGLPPSAWDSVLGKRVRRAVKAGHPLTAATVDRRS